MNSATYLQSSAISTLNTKTTTYITIIVFVAYFNRWYLVATLAISVIWPEEEEEKFFAPGNFDSLSVIHPIMVLVLLAWVALYNKHKLFKALIITLVLGGWWATQEFNWGLWWNYDVIESSIVFLVILVAVIRHKKSYVKSKDIYTTTQVIVLFSAYRLFINYGATGTQHTFATKKGNAWLFLVVPIMLLLLWQRKGSVEKKLMVFWSLFWITWGVLTYSALLLLPLLIKITRLKSHKTYYKVAALILFHELITHSTFSEYRQTWDKNPFFLKGGLGGDNLIAYETQLRQNFRKPGLNISAKGLKLLWGCKEAYLSV